MASVLVIGGGPAGSSAARLLATWGHRVHLITRPATEARLAESLPPSCAKLFAAIGVSEAVERAAFIRATGNTVWWGSDIPRVELFVEGGRGWQVEAEALAAVLLDEAARTGVTIERRSIALESLSKASSALETLARGGPLDPTAQFILDCSGRAGILARARGLRQYDEGPRTVALVASWRLAHEWNVPDPTHTVVESYTDGWAWSVPTSIGRRHVAVMVDPKRSDLSRGISSRETYLAEIRKTREFRQLLADDSIDEGPWGWDASTYHATRYADDDALLVGDAGSFIDPLSSAGVKKAMASGWLAAVTAHTCLRRPEMRAHALKFFDARETEIHQRLTAITRRMLAEAAPGHAHRFWADRWDEAEAARAADPDEDREIRAAYDRIRQAPHLALRLGAGVVIADRAAVSGVEIVLEPRIVTADQPAGVRYVRDVDVTSLIRLAPQAADAGVLFETYCRTTGPVSLPDFLGALATAVARGWLVAE